jgi:hypothetical protein
MSFIFLYDVHYLRSVNGTLLRVHTAGNYMLQHSSAITYTDSSFTFIIELCQGFPFTFNTAKT